MWIVYDIETSWANANVFRCGCIKYDNGKEFTFFSKEAMYDHIDGLAKQCYKKGRRLYIYAHNLKFDFIALGCHTKPHIEVFTSYPFIADSYNYVGTERDSYAKWIDTMGLFRGSLEMLGDIVGCKKGVMPSWNEIPDYQPQFWEVQVLSQYCMQDCNVLYLFMHKLKKELITQNIRVKGIYTTNQIAISNFMRTLQKSDNPELYLDDVAWGKFYKTEYADEILRAYRGGRVECFKTGLGTSVNGNDVNSLYPYAATQIDYPDLSSEKLIDDPLRVFSLLEILMMTGVSHCIVETPISDKVGLLPVRQQLDAENEKTTYPISAEKRIFLVGDWTHYELLEAYTRGYKIHHIYHSVVFDTIPNPLKKHMQHLYTRRKESKTDWDNLFYKSMMNGMIGKMAQRRPHRRTIKVDVEQVPEFESRGWHSCFSSGTDVWMEKEEGIDWKRYYAPIIPALITGWSRVYIYRHLSYIPKQCLWRTSTDSIYWDSKHSTTTVFKYGEGLGEWKREHTRQSFHQYDRGAYRIGETIHVNRVPRKAQTLRAFENGKLLYQDLAGPKKENAGEFTEQERNLAYEGTPMYEDIIIDSRVPITENLLNSVENITGETHGSS